MERLDVGLSGGVNKGWALFELDFITSFFNGLGETPELEEISLSAPV